MADTPILETQIRTERRRRQMIKLRQQGQLPGIVYGHKEEPQCVSVPADILERILRSGDRFVELKTDSDSQTVQIKDLQWDYLGKDLVHVDFLRVSKGEKVETQVGFELRGTPVGVTHGGVFEHLLPSLNVRASATATPNAIHINVNDLEVGDQVLVKDLEIPEGVDVLDEPETVVVRVSEKVELTDEELMPTEQAEPERIGREEQSDEDEGAE